MVYRDSEPYDYFPIIQCIPSPINSSTKCSINSIKCVALGISVNLSNAKNNEVNPKISDTIIPTGYKILNRAGMVKRKATGKCSILNHSEFSLSFKRLVVKRVHHNAIYLGPYKIFPVKEPLEFTLGFTERKNEMEVL